ncbi:MAG: 2-oxoacid:acceptor oxidoreductase subunit alpha [Chloroflexi bacterium]|nr:2-oxoacid:acceptor oxidoreductase subunit alpha [Chloroflexota bacterium]
MSLNIMVGGEAGQGVQSVGFLLARAFARGGYHVFADQDYESRVRGGHNFYRVRAEANEVGAIRETVDILIALNEESIRLHEDEVAADGVIIFDAGASKSVHEEERFFPLPLEKLSEESGGGKLMVNTVALGASLGVIGYDPGIIETVVHTHFGGGEVAGENARAVRAGYKYAQENSAGRLNRRLAPLESERRMLLNGNEAIALGAIAAGCTFMAAYPMTPASSIMEYLAGKADECGMVVVQPEDEISAIHMVIGAAFAGARAMTATSGGGFCLMVEGLGLAGMTETPIVVVEGQRAGPAIGLPTRTEQSDLGFVIHAAHGEFPRAVLAPASIEDAFWLTVKAFNLAEAFQVPVILLTDQHLASSYGTVRAFDLSKVTIDRGLLHADSPESNGYRRHRFTLSGVSARAFPLQSRALVITDSDEHDEEGHLTEDADTRTAMMLKRLRKIEGLRDRIGPPRIYGSDGAQTTLVGWGSTYGALKEAVDILQKEGEGVNLLHFSQLWPFPADAVFDLLRDSKRIFVVENNATGQLAQLIRMETGIQATGSILKFDGRPMTAAWIVEGLKEKSSG